jgi:alanine racemase
MMTPRHNRQLLKQPRREAWVEVNLDALEYNLKTLPLPAGIGLMAVLKADGYGHGVSHTLPVLEGCGVSHIAVASVDEALEIRQMSATLPILVLGPSPDWALDVAHHHRITLAIADAHQLPLMTAYHQQTGNTLQVHVKIDTGMHRVGISLDDANTFLAQCIASPAIHVDGVFSHLTNGADTHLTAIQLTRWQSVVDHMDAWCHQHGHTPACHRHLLNTPGTLSGQWLQAGPYHTLVRTGMAMWGYEGHKTPLRPVMGLKGRVTHLQPLPSGEGVSYGPSYCTNKPRLIATLPLGYADGVPRGLSNVLTGLCQGVSVRQVGTITMDQMMWDVTDVAGVALGSVITLLDTTPGSPLTLSPWARVLNTIEYELMCGLRVRLPKIYTRD